MSKLPPSVVQTPWHLQLEDAGMERVHQGKVRDTYKMPGHAHLLAVVADDRVSIFDHVLPARVPRKGEVLTALTDFFLTRVLSVSDHLCASGGGNVELYLPPLPKRSKRILRRMIIVRRLDMLPVEYIIRGYLTGSGWRSYQKTGEVCGHKLRSGYRDGDKLDKPLFTPTTKAEEGHDEPLTEAEVREKYGDKPADEALETYRRLAAHAREKGVILADSKFEYGMDGDKGFCLADEVGTPDSSRYWDAEAHAKTRESGKAPPPFDKELVRNWGREVAVRVTEDGGTRDIKGINNLDPLNPVHAQAVHGLAVPEDLLRRTSEVYMEIFRRLTGMTLDRYQYECMHLV